MNKTNRKKAALLFALLLFPSILYVVFSSGKHTFLYRPILGPKTVNVDGDTLYHSVSLFSFTNCAQNKISMKDLKGKIIVLGFYNNSDSLSSARIYTQMMTLHEKFETTKDFVLVSISVNNDPISVSGACRVESRFPIQKGRWLLGVLDDDVYEFATQQLFLESEESKTESSPSFNYKKLVLLDKFRRIRSYSDALQYAETKILGDDIKVVIAEDFIPKKNKTKKKEI